MKYLNRIFFSFFLLLLLGMSFFADSTFFYYDTGKPWQLQPFTHEDSLCVKYKNDYKILGKNRVLETEADSTKSIVEILVDAWGVPLEFSLMQEDFALFPKSKCLFAIHSRLANRNTHAEGVEFFNNFELSTYYFGGDSTEYDSRQYLHNRVKETVFCQKCSDEMMLAKLDSAIADTSVIQPRMLAWTTQTSRDGNREKLHRTLAGIAALMQKYPEMQFIVQGTHRPVLGTPETRRMYHTHWVPVVVQNGKNNSK